MQPPKVRKTPRKQSQRSEIEGAKYFDAGVILCCIHSMFGVRLLNPPYLRKDDTMSKLTKKQQWFKQIILTKKDKVYIGPDVRHFAFNFPFFPLLCIMLMCEHRIFF